MKKNLEETKIDLEGLPCEIKSKGEKKILHETPPH
jgi:hypothetical protein